MKQLLSVDADIFLCHNCEDKDFVRKLATDLKQVSIDAWFDEWELEPGDSLLDRIGTALERSVYVGVILSPNSVNSKWCKKELNQALSRELKFGEKTIIPMLLTDVELPHFLQEKYYLDFSREYYRPFTQLSAMIHLFDVHSVNVALQENPPKSIHDVKTIFLSCNEDTEKLQTQEGVYRRLKKMAKMRPDQDALLALGALCFQTERDSEAKETLEVVLKLDKSFDSFQELNTRVRMLAREKKPFNLDKRTRLAMAYLGVLYDDEDYVLNAAYDTDEKDVLITAGVFYLHTYNADIDAAIGYFIKATEGLSVEAREVKRCDSALYEILKDKKVIYPKLSWDYIEKAVERWNKHKWSLT